MTMLDGFQIVFNNLNGFLTIRVGISLIKKLSVLEGHEFIFVLTVSYIRLLKEGMNE